MKVFYATLGLMALFLLFWPERLSASKESPDRPLGVLMSVRPSRGAFPLIVHGRPAVLLSSSQDDPGVTRAMHSFRGDLSRVSGSEPLLAADRIPSDWIPEDRIPKGGISASPVPAGRSVVIAGTLGRSPLLDDLALRGKADFSVLKGKWEQFLIQVVDRPYEGVDQALVIAGSDKRGTIFGIYELSAQMGVSPWYWWADVPVEPQRDLYVSARGYTLGEPAVKYRGIFLNDEEPALGRWAVETFGGFNSRFYEKLFELLLRMKSNFMWPAMWWASFNSDDPANTRLADEMGIVMGTSHHEPLNRAHAEWKPWGGREWDYARNPEQLRAFWTEGIQRTRDVETVITLAMRGDGDEAMSPQTNVALLQQIVADQREIIAKVTGKPVTSFPQVWSLYKEVQDYYDQGMRVPDDVTLLLCDDNWGNIRKLPAPGEPPRGGGYGIYYHFDYVGGPRNYKWLNTSPIQRTWEQMNLAYRHGVDRLWVVNVGDLKPMEFPIEFFLDFAWAPDHWTADKLPEYTVQWAFRQFGQRHAQEIADLLDGYTRINSRRKPELLEPATYSLTHYREAERVVEEYRALEARARTLAGQIPERYRDAFYQLVWHPVAACANLNELYVTVGKNRLYAAQGRASANDLARQAEALFRKDAEMSEYYNKTLAGGKWNHMMDQTHIGYTYWQQPDKNSMPRVNTVEPLPGAAIGVSVEGASGWWPGNPGSPGNSGTSAQAVLPEFDRFNGQRYYVDIFNRGAVPFEVTVHAASPLVQVSAGKALVDKDLRVWVEVRGRNWPDAPTRVPLTIQGAGATVVVTAVLNPWQPSGKGSGVFVENNACVAIEAEHFNRVTSLGAATWQLVPGLGRTLSAMMPVPVNTLRVPLSDRSPCLEYDFVVREAGTVTVSALVSPTLNIYNGEGLKFAVSVDGQTPQITGIPAKPTNQQWEEWVRRNIVEVQTRHTLSHAGVHTLKIWMMDPGIVLQRLHIDRGGLKPSYLGPPESKRL
jgi:hypothetical protein